MPRIHKAHLKSLAHIHHMMILAGHKMRQHPHGVIHIIYRHNLRFSRPLCLAVLPLRLGHLNMRAVFEHNVTELARRRRRKHLSAKPVPVQKRQKTGMVNMRMRDKYIVNLRGIDRYLLIDVEIRPLFHAAVHQNVMSAKCQIMTAPRHLMCSP